MNEVQVDQIWEDWDARTRNEPYRRRIKVLRVDERHAYCESVTLTGKQGRCTRILLDRLKPSATGYRLIQDAKET